MTKDLTFATVCDFIKNENGDLTEAVDNLCGVGIVCAAVAIGPTVLPLIAAKNEMVKLGKTLLEKVTAKKEGDYSARMRRMEVAYGLICYTAFFDALDQNLPDGLRQTIALLPENKESMTRPLNSKASDEALSPDSVFEENLPFPLPTNNYEDIKAALLSIYERLAKNFAY